MSTLSPQPLKFRTSDGTPLIFYAIDGEETATQYFDPDDAFALEHHPDGSYTVHIAIVDTTIIPKKTTEYNKAASQGESIYAPAYVPMLSIDRNKQIGLKDGENRAMVTTVEVNAQGEITHKEFGIYNVDVVSMTHKQAAQALGEHKKDLTAFDGLADVLMHARSERTHRTEYDEKTGLFVGAEGNVKYLPEDETLRSVHKIVREVMILGNVAAASWAEAARLPFLFRNHGPSDGNEFRVSDLAAYDKDESSRQETMEMIQRFMQVPANYGFKNKGHFGLGVASYAHTTSPMRRYADMVNQKQLAYVMEVATLTESLLDVGVRSGVDAQKIHAFVWDHLGDAVIPALVQARLYQERDEQGVRLARSKSNLYGGVKALCELAQEEGLIDASRVSDLAKKHYARDVQAVAMPYIPLEMAQVGEGLNNTLSKSQQERRAYNKLRLDSWLKKVMAAPDIGILQSASTEEFTNLLERAAITGQMNEPLQQEVLRRMDMGEKLKPYKAYAGILFLAPNDEDGMGLWKELKQRVLEDLRFNGRAMNQLLDMLQDSNKKIGRFTAAPIYSEVMSQGKDGNSLYAAQYVLPMAGGQFCAPSYTIMPEDFKELAKSEAQFQLVRHLAHHSLVPVNNVVLPEALSTQVYSVSKPLDLLQRIAEENGLVLEYSTRPSRRLVRYKLSSSEENAAPEEAEYVEGQQAAVILKRRILRADGKPEDEIIARGEKFAADNPTDNSYLSSQEDALRRAAQRVLRHPTVKVMLPKGTYVDFSAPEDPIKALEHFAQGHHLKLEFSVPQRVEENGHPQQLLILTVKELGQGKADGSVLFRGEITADTSARAKYELCRQALEDVRGNPKYAPRRSSSVLNASARPSFTIDHVTSHAPLAQAPAFGLGSSQ